MKLRLCLLSFAIAISFTGCASYVNSPRARDYSAARAEAFSHPIIARAFNAKPAIRFPATIGLAAQDAATQQQLRALDAEGALDALKSLPKLAGTVNVNSLMFSDGSGEYSVGGKSQAIWNKSDVLLREAAARLHTDAVLIMKIETHTSDGEIFAPLTTLSLGLFPNDHRHIVATALAALVDTRTGYVYGVLERSAGRSCLTMSWDDTSKDRAMRRAQHDAMAKMFREIPAFWRGVLAKHGG
jgi:hypothetical protein